MNKKAVIAIVIGAILILGGTLFVLYLFLFAEDSDEGLMGMFPFGDREEMEPREKDDEEDENNETKDNEQENVLRKISEHPVADEGFFVFTDGEENYIRYTSRGEGVFYEVKENGKEHKSLSEERDHLEGLYRSFWLDKETMLAYLESGENGKVVMLTQLEENNDASIPVVVNKLGMPEDTIEAVFAPESKSIFYTTKKENGIGISGFVSSFENINDVSGRHTLSSQIREWNIDWPSENKITLTTKPSGYTTGRMHLLDLATGVVTVELREVDGLTTKTNSSGSMTLFNQSEGNGFTLWIYDHQNDSSKEVTGIKTLTDKCEWKNTESFVCAVPREIPKEIYPDAWYQGKVSFNDKSIVEINIEDQLSYNDIFVLENIQNEDLKEADIQSIRFNESKEKLLFIDRKTSDLWIYDLEPEDESGENSSEGSGEEI